MKAATRADMVYGSKWLREAEAKPRRGACSGKRIRKTSAPGHHLFKRKR